MAFLVPKARQERRAQAFSAGTICCSHSFTLQAFLETCRLQGPEYWSQPEISQRLSRLEEEAQAHVRGIQRLEKWETEEGVSSEMWKNTLPGSWYWNWALKDE